MTTRLASRQLARLRRIAKKLASDQGIPLSEAHQRLASERGFKSWALMVRNSSHKPTSWAKRSAVSDPVKRILGNSGLQMTLYYVRPAFPNIPDWDGDVIVH